MEKHMHIRRRIWAVIGGNYEISLGIYFCKIKICVVKKAGDVVCYAFARDLCSFFLLLPSYIRWL